MIFRPDRGRRGGDRTLIHRMAILAVGAVLALAGILWEQRVLIWIAIALLAAGMALSVYGRRHGSQPEDGPET